LATLNIVKVILDPEDPLTLYAASEANGLFYSLDGGNSWQVFSNFNTGHIRDVVVDYHNKCIVYAVTANKLFKTANCGRDWNNVYYHQKNQVILTALDIDSVTSTTLYLGTSEGEILKSIDGGNSWLTIHRLQGDKIIDIIIDPNNSKIIYVGTGRNGILKTKDAGKTWNSLTEGLKPYSGSQNYLQLIYDPATPNGLVYVSKAGLLHTVDGGSTWQSVTLLPSNKTTTILAVAVNPQNSAEFYYTTASTLVKTVDGGIKWSSVKLPYNRYTTGIIISPVNPNIIYLTTRAAQ
jgi:photosystem II stability/assembly factor-like uncharacterized protein